MKSVVALLVALILATISFGQTANTVSMKPANDGKKIVLGPVDNKATIAEANKIFAEIDQNFKAINQPSSPSVAAEFAVYIIDGEGTLENIMALFPGRQLAITQGQAIALWETYKDYFGARDVFMVIKSKDKNYLAQFKTSGSPAQTSAHLWVFDDYITIYGKPILITIK